MVKIQDRLSPHKALKDIKNYGYEFSWIKYLILVLGVSIGVILFGGYLGLTGAYILALTCIIVINLPIMVQNNYLSKLEYQRFIDVGNYIEQLLYSFKRHSKIDSALEDTLQIFPYGQMHDVIIQALEHMRESFTKGNAYEEALGFIAAEFDCGIIHRIHKFLVSVEVLGGAHEDAVDLLIEDRNKWVNRTLEAQKGKVNLRRNMTLAVIFSLAIISSTVLMIPKEFGNIKGNHIAMITTLIILSCNYLLWVFVQCKLSGSYIDSGGALTEETMERYMDKLEQKDLDTKKAYIFGGIGVLISLIIYIQSKSLFVAATVLFLVWLVSTQKTRTANLAKRKIGREVEKAFPDWMLGVSLRLQTENVQIAIENSVEEAPYVMRKELGILIEKVEEDPLGIRPYMAFFSELALPELQSAMKMLYAMSQYGSKEISEQISTLVERNSKLQDKSEQMKMEDYLAGMGFFILLPMLLGSIKMLVDMMLLVVNLLGESSSFI